jgi:hypothetical protein
MTLTNAVEIPQLSKASIYRTWDGDERASGDGFVDEGENVVGDESDGEEQKEIHVD